MSAEYPLAAAMTPDGSNVLYGVVLGAPVAFQLFLWNAQNRLAVKVATLNSTAQELAISADAHRVAVVTGKGTYTVDLAAQTSVLLAADVPTSHSLPQFSGDGRFLAYLAKENLTINQVYLYDFDTASNILVSQSYNSTVGVNATCDSPAINAAGRFVAYRSAATNLVPGDTNGFADIFLWDRLTGGTTLISAAN